MSLPRTVSALLLTKTRPLRNPTMLKMLLLGALLTPSKPVDKCKKYHNKFMTALHKSLELECEKHPEKYYPVCVKVVKQLKEYNELRSKYCYEDSTK